MLFDVDGSKAVALAERLGAECLSSMHQVAREADLVLLCTPIKETPKVIREAIPHMRKGAIICEIASLKLKTVEALKSASDQGIQPVSIHPMFGPDIESIAGQTIILVPVSDPRREECVTRYLFPGAEVAALDAETHDYYMAAILSLTYFANLVFAKSMQRMDPMLLRRLAGTTFTVQHALAQSVVEESPELVESLISENAYAKEAINGFIDDSRYLRRLLKNDPEGFKELCGGIRAAIGSHEGDGGRIRREISRALRLSNSQGAYHNQRQFEADSR